MSKKTTKSEITKILNPKKESPKVTPMTEEVEPEDKIAQEKKEEVEET